MIRRIETKCPDLIRRLEKPLSSYVSICSDPWFLLILSQYGNIYNKILIFIRLYLLLKKTLKSR
jgi:hypothetical protein